MKFKQPWSFLSLGSAVTLLAIGGVACTQPSAVNPDQKPAEEVAQDSMPGMHHDSGMHHGAMMNMDLGVKNETFDLRFIDAMVPHHEGAVAMAQEALQKSNRTEIKQLAEAIIAAQEQEIQELKDWRQAWYPNAGEQAVMYDAQTKSDVPMSSDMRSSMMMQGDLGAADEEFDLRFINAMIPHHEGAIDMAQQALTNSDRPEIQQLAGNIVSSQRQEIEQMQQWRQQWYGQ